MYLFFKVNDYYPMGGFKDLEFVFDDKEELYEKVNNKLGAFYLREEQDYENGDRITIECYSQYQNAEIVIWKLDSLNDLKAVEDSRNFLVYQNRPHYTVWEGLSPKSKEDIDRMNQMLYDDIVDKLNLV